MDIWRFDWVQYTGFTNQAMARNVGETLGVLAPIKLVDKQGNPLPASELGETVVDVDGLHCAEGLLRMLKPPKWPQDILGNIDFERARAGKKPVSLGAHASGTSAVSSSSSVPKKGAPSSLANASLLATKKSSSTRG